MLGVGGEVGPFVFVVAVIIEFFGSVGVADVAPTIGADGVVVLAKGGDADACPCGSGIGEQGLDVVAFEPSGFWQSGELAEGWIDAHEIDGTFADAAGFGDTGNDPNEGCASGFLPEGEFSPVFLLAEMPAVVAPENDDGIVLVG